jgi:hypothetical protein
VIPLLATPFWVNLLLLVPIGLLLYWRTHRLCISTDILIFTALFGAAFGFIESASVIYLRAAIGVLPGYHGTLMDVWRQATGAYNQQLLTQKLPESLLTVEVIRETGTMIMLIMVAFIAARRVKERIALFLWTFAVWDIGYYLYLYLTVRWPQKVTTKDVLFLIPQAWYAQVWFPLLVSSLTLLAVLLSVEREKRTV